MTDMVSAHELVHYSESYLDFLEQAIPNTNVHKLGNSSDGFMYACSMRSEAIGVVINSLPFFGSHGGPYGCPNEEGKKNLLREFRELSNDLSALSATIVENPFDPLNVEFCRNFGLEVIDDRIGQFTSLPDSSENIEETLLNRFHVKTRNAIRKGLRQPLSIYLADCDRDWDWMQSVHSKSIGALGGTIKTREVFEALKSVFKENATLHVCLVGNVRVAGLVSIKHEETIEYFTPVVEADFRETQVLSALILSLMTEFTKEGFKLWNWGGTWRSQAGVYRFKNRFGATDHRYRYFNTILDEKIREIPTSTLKTEFPYFYTHRY